MKLAAIKTKFHHGDAEARSLRGEKLQEWEKQTQSFNTHGTPGQAEATEKYRRTLKNTISAFEKFFWILLATLREIFDENAYQRFLLRTGSAASVQSYREFMRERESAMATKPRCC